MRVFIGMLEPFQSPVFFLVATKALAEAALLAAAPLFFAPAMAVRRRMQGCEEEDDGVEGRVKNGTAVPYFLFYRKLRVISAVNFFTLATCLTS